MIDKIVESLTEIENWLIELEMDTKNWLRKSYSKLDTNLRML